MEKKQPYEFLPPDTTPLWRFVSLPKFLSLLHSAKLYFNRADTFSDRWEGAFNEGSVREQAKLMGVEVPEDLIKLACWIPTHSYVSCWHAAEHESMALWSIYGEECGGVALKTSMGKLSKAFSPRSESHDSNLFSQEVCAVQYIDYKTEHPFLNDLCGPLCYKRQAFAFEQEIRVIRMLLPTTPTRREDGSKGRAIHMAEPPERTGMLVETELGELVDEIYVAPESPAYLLDSVRGVLKRYEFSIPVRQSELDDIPEFSFRNLTKR
ncbi:MAG: hypothetical protein R6W72_07405 [Desulfurivibrionaceae bacterium]